MTTSLSGQERAAISASARLRIVMPAEPAGLEGIRGQALRQRHKPVADRLGNLLLDIEFVIIAHDRIAEHIEVQAFARRAVAMKSAATATCSVIGEITGEHALDSRQEAELQQPLEHRPVSSLPACSCLPGAHGPDDC